MLTGQRKGLAPGSSVRRGSRLKIPRSWMRLVGLWSCPQPYFGRRFTPSPVVTKSAYASRHGLEAPSPPSWMTSFVSYGKGSPLSRNLCRLLARVENSPVKLPRLETLILVTRLRFIKGSLPSPLTPIVLKRACHTAGSSSKARDFSQPETPRLPGRNAVGDSLSNKMWNAGCATKTVHVTGPTSETTQRRTASRRKKLSVEDRSWERLGFGKRQCCCRLLRAKTKTRVPSASVSASLVLVRTTGQFEGQRLRHFEPQWCPNASAVPCTSSPSAFSSERDTAENAADWWFLASDHSRRSERQRMVTPPTACGSPTPGTRRDDCTSHDASHVRPQETYEWARKVLASAIRETRTRSG